MSVLNEKHFHDEEAAYAWVEARVWPNGVICPHCGGVERISKMQGKSTRIGCYKCYQCRKPFTVKVGTIFESSHIKMHIWLQAIFLMCSSKKGISSNQLHRTLGITLKSAWFLSHRIREAMKINGLPPMGGGGEVVEADETYYGDKDTVTKRTRLGKAALSSKRTIISLVERNGPARSFHVPMNRKVFVEPILAANIDRKAKLYTDESNLYTGIGKQFAAHGTVAHKAGEYVRGNIHSNTVEGYFSIFKRGMRGIYQHCSEKHLHRYLAEFDFRYSARKGLGYDDVTRTENAVKGVMGKRLTYRTTAAG
ncbi:MAG: IS1595 family transposase [Alphaproteobacteria bacterium]